MSLFLAFFWPIWRAHLLASAPGRAGTTGVLAALSGILPLPLLPLLAILAARVLADAETSRTRFRLWPAGGLLAVVGVALTALPWWPMAPR